jgi:hypothetical protein
MAIRKPDVHVVLPDGWTRTDEPAALDEPVTIVPADASAGALHISMPMAFEQADSPRAQLELVCREAGWGSPHHLEPFESSLGPGCIAVTPDAPVPLMWCFQPEGCPFVLASWMGDPEYADDAGGILATAAAGPMMRNERWLLASVLEMTRELARGEDIVPHALIVSGAVHHHCVLAGGLGDLDRLVDEVRRDAQSRRAEIVSVCGEYRRRYPDGEVYDVVVLYIESKGAARQYEFPTDASVAPRRIGPVEVVPATGWGPFVGLLHGAHGQELTP